MKKLTNITIAGNVFPKSYKLYGYGDLKIISSIDSFTDCSSLMINFGTDKMPIGDYKHTSISHPSRYPTWEEIKEIKQLIHGDNFVFQALPPNKAYVNVHENCFHIWEIL